MPTTGCAGLRDESENKFGLVMLPGREEAMRRVVLQWMSPIFTCACVTGCLLNSVRQITTEPRSSPDSEHAIAVIGIGLDVTWPYTDFQLTLPEYSVKKQGMTGNCYHYNRIEAIHPSIPAKVTYLAFVVPANAYAYPDLADTISASSLVGSAFIAPPRSAVYFGDFVYVGNKTVEFRRDINAARTGARKILPPNTALELAESTAAPGAHTPLCTP